MAWEVEYTDEFEQLIGGKKVGDDRWYDEYIPYADKIYDEHLRTLKNEGLI